MYFILRLFFFDKEFGKVATVDSTTTPPTQNRRDTMARINIVTPESANPEQKALYEAIQAQLGMVPNFLKVFANSPAALKAWRERIDHDPAAMAGARSAR